MITIPEPLRALALRYGDDGRRWLAVLPDLCQELSRRWSLTLGPSYPASHISLVLQADQGDRSSVLKIPLPFEIEVTTLAAGQRSREAAAYRIWNGDGATALIAQDQSSGAMLLERCVPGRSLDQLPDQSEADQVAADLLRRLWRSAPPDHPFERLSELAIRLADDLPGRFDAAGGPFDRWLVDAAIESLGRLSGPDSPEVLLHGDFHHDNILSTTREPWLAIDPLPMVGEPAYDAVQYLLFRKGDLADPAAEWPAVIDRFCGFVDVDPARVKDWMVARLVSDALAEGDRPDRLEARQGVLWTARLVQRLR